MKKLLVLCFIFNISFAQNNAADYLQPSPPSTVKVEINTNKTTIKEEIKKDGSVVELERVNESIPEEFKTEFPDKEKENLTEQEKIKQAIEAAKENNDPGAVKELQKKLK